MTHLLHAVSIPTARRRPRVAWHGSQAHDPRTLTSGVTSQVTSQISARRPEASSTSSGRANGGMGRVASTALTSRSCPSRAVRSSSRVSAPSQRVTVTEAMAGAWHAPRPERSRAPITRQLQPQVWHARPCQNLVQVGHEARPASPLIFAVTTNDPCTTTLPGPRLGSSHGADRVVVQWGAVTTGRQAGSPLHAGRGGRSRHIGASPHRPGRSVRAPGRSWRRHPQWRRPRGPGHLRRSR